MTRVCSQQKGGGRKRARVHPEPQPGRSQCDDCLAYQKAWRDKRKAACTGDEGCSHCRALWRASAAYHANATAMNLRTAIIRRGISVEDYDQMYADQGGRCAICGKEETAMYAGLTVKRLAIDHCHDTGRTRALLCNNCNRALGMFGDDPAVLRAAADYIEGHRA